MTYLRSQDTPKMVYNTSSHSLAISSWTPNTEELNPFKEFMKSDGEDDQLTLSLPAIRKKHPNNRSLLVDLPTNRKTVKADRRSTLKNIFPNDKPSTVDLCTPTHLAVKSKNVKIINLFINHDGCFRIFHFRVGVDY